MIKMPERSVGLFCGCGMKVMSGMPTLMPRGPGWLAGGPRQSSRTEAVPTCRPPPLHPCRPPLLALLCNSRGPACRSAEGGLYAWSQSTPNSIMLEGVSCVSSAQRLFTCAEPRGYFASPSVFIMMALFLSFFFFRAGATNMPSLDPLSIFYNP